MSQQVSRLSPTFLFQLCPVSTFASSSSPTRQHASLTSSVFLYFSVHPHYELMLWVEGRKRFRAGTSSALTEPESIPRQSEASITWTTEHKSFMAAGSGSGSGSGAGNAVRAVDPPSGSRSQVFRVQSASRCYLVCSTPFDESGARHLSLSLWNRQRRCLFSLQSSLNRRVFCLFVFMFTPVVMLS